MNIGDFEKTMQQLKVKKEEVMVACKWVIVEGRKIDDAVRIVGVDRIELEKVISKVLSCKNN